MRAEPNGATIGDDASNVVAVAELDIDGMLARFKDRAAAVKKRPLPPIEGEERKKYIQQSQLDFQDFANVGDAEWSLEDGVLTLRVDLRPPSG